jgi:ubiquinone/menaquinone biosynthesis C-methylase UbiE
MVVLEELEQARASFLKYTRAAFLRLPQIEKPRILDIGCGSGIPAIELAKLSDGEVIGIDIDQSCIDEFNRKIKEEALSNRVKAINLSLFEMNFPDETFDVIWVEGYFRTIEFERALKACCRFTLTLASVRLQARGYCFIACGCLVDRVL